MTTSILKHVSLSEAMEILGEDHVVTPQQSAELFGQEPREDLPICYLRSELEQAARENEAGEANWYLFTSSGLSPIGINCREGKLSQVFPNLTLDFTCPAHATKIVWGTRRDPAGIFLINAQVQLEKLSYLGQNQQMINLEHHYQRVPPVILVELALALKYLYGVTIITKDTMTDAELRYGNLIAIQPDPNGSIRVGNIHRCGLAGAMLLSSPRECLA